MLTVEELGGVYRNSLQFLQSIKFHIVSNFRCFYFEHCFLALLSRDEPYAPKLASSFNLRT